MSTGKKIAAGAGAVAVATGGAVAPLSQQGNAAGVTNQVPGIHQTVSPNSAHAPKSMAQIQSNVNQGKYGKGFTARNVGKLGQNVQDSVGSVANAQKRANKGIEAARQKASVSQSSTKSAQAGKSSNQGIQSFQAKSSGQAKSGTASGVAKSAASSGKSGGGQGR